MSQSSHAEIYKFLNQHGIAVISYTDQTGKPHSAAVEFVVREDLSIIFGTGREFRKYKSLLGHNEVALVIGGVEEVTIQYEGKAHEMESGPTSQEHQSLITRVTQNYFPLDPAEFTYFEVRPTWVRYTDVSCKPWRQFELDLAS